MASVYHVLAQGNSGAGRLGNTVTNKALTSNVVTLTTGSAHGYVANDHIVVSIGDNVFDGGYVVASVPTSTTLTYARGASDVTSTAVTGGLITGGGPRTFSYINNQVIASNIATLTTVAAHGLVVGDIVVVSGVSSVLDGTWTVATVPTSTTFTFPSTTATVSTAAVSPTGVVMRQPAAGFTVSNRGSVNNTAQLTTGTAHGLAVDDYIQTSVGVAGFDGYFRVTGVPSSTAVSYATAASGTVASGASFAGGVAKRVWQGYLYTVPAGYSATVSTLTITSRDTVPGFYRIGIIPKGETLNESDWLVYNSTIPSFDAITLTLGKTLATGDQVYFWASTPLLTFQLFGAEVN